MHVDITLLAIAKAILNVCTHSLSLILSGSNVSNYFEQLQ